MRDWADEEEREMWRDLWFPGLAVVVVVSVISAAFIVGLAVLLGPSVCKARWSSFETRFDIVTGCQLKTKDGWVPEDKVRVFVKEVGA